MNRLSKALTFIALSTFAAMPARSLEAAAQDSDTTFQFMPTDSEKPTDAKVNVGLQTRVNFSWENPEQGKSSMDFHGEHLNLVIDGTITKGLTYMMQQCLNKLDHVSNDVFSATDMLLLRYQASPNWTFTGGKQLMAVGGYEYNAIPIDMYIPSVIWRHLPCFEFGVAAAYTTDNGLHKFTAQMTNSPFALPGESCFAYNLMWEGHMGAWSTLWSVNAFEAPRDHFANYIAIGNRFNINPVIVEVDLVNRYFKGQKYLLGDYSVIAKVGMPLCDKVDVFVKGGYERYRIRDTRNYFNNPFVGVGIEYYPLPGHRNVRMHALWDMNTDDTGTHYQQIQVGLTWKVNLLSVR